MARRAADERALAHEAIEEHAASGWRAIMSTKTAEGACKFDTLQRLAEERSRLWDERRAQGRGRGRAHDDLGGAEAAGGGGGEGEGVEDVGGEAGGISRGSRTELVEPLGADSANELGLGQETLAVGSGEEQQHQQRTTR